MDLLIFGLTLLAVLRVAANDPLVLGYRKERRWEN